MICTISCCFASDAQMRAMLRAANQFAFQAFLASLKAGKVLPRYTLSGSLRLNTCTAQIWQTDYG